MNRYSGPTWPLLSIGRENDSDHPDGKRNGIFYTFPEKVGKYSILYINTYKIQFSSYIAIYR